MQVKVVLSLVVEYFVQFIFCQTLLLETHIHNHNESRSKYIGCSKATKCESLIQPERSSSVTLSLGFVGPPWRRPLKLHPRWRRVARAGGRSLGPRGGGGFQDLTLQMPLLSLVGLPPAVLGCLTLSGSEKGWNCHCSVCILEVRGGN